jgi:hypothetical protein
MVKTTTATANDQMARLIAARDRNRLAMEAEKAELATRKAEEAAREARMKIEGPAMLAAMADLVLGCPGRGLTAGMTARLQEIRSRNLAK